MTSTILGMPTPLYTQIHVAISIIAIAAGFVVVRFMLAARTLTLITGLFLCFTMLTSLTGFFFPYHGITPGIVLGILSVILLLLAIPALYVFHLAGAWRPIYVITSIIALWFNLFVFIVQSFQKVPGLHALAPTGTELPFKLAQGITLIICILLGISAVKKFHPAPAIAP